LFLLFVTKSKTQKTGGGYGEVCLRRFLLGFGFGFWVWGFGFVCDAGWFAGVCAGIRELLARFTRRRSVF
jgi:hypothetical protein